MPFQNKPFSMAGNTLVYIRVLCFMYKVLCAHPAGRAGGRAALRQGGVIVTVVGGGETRRAHGVWIVSNIKRAG